jgi:hypothetical protein
MTPRSGSFARTALVLMVAIGTAGCASLIKTALGRAGVEDNSDAPGGGGVEQLRRPVASAPTAGVHTSTYEYIPVSSLWRMALGRPHSVAYNASRWAARNACEPTPRGFADVLPIPEGAPVTPFASWGPIHLVALGVPGIYLGQFVNGDPANLASLMMEETARMTSQGAGCGFNVFVGVTFGNASRVVVSS